MRVEKAKRGWFRQQAGTADLCINACGLSGIGFDRTSEALSRGSTRERERAIGYYFYSRPHVPSQVVYTT